MFYTVGQEPNGNKTSGCNLCTFQRNLGRSRPIGRTPRQLSIRLAAVCGIRSESPHSVISFISLPLRSIRRSASHFLVRRLPCGKHFSPPAYLVTSRSRQEIRDPHGPLSSLCCLSSSVLITSLDSSEVLRPRVSLGHASGV